ncbi:MAG: energy transducer TonB [Candidatus Polarisedimenticolia bacterium]
MRTLIGIGIAILAHAAILLFGGLLFFSTPHEEKKKAQVEDVDLVQDEAKEEEKKDEQEEQPVEEAEEAESIVETDDMPDLRELVQLDAAAAAPSLDAMSLSALADSLSPASGTAGFFADSVDLGSGGRIGGTGKAVEGEALDEIFSMADLDQKPRPIYQGAPNYPYELRRRKLEGTVQVLFVVNEQGKVVNPLVEQATHPEFERAALDAVRQWKFEPAVREGKKVQCKMRVPLRFSVS